MDTLKGFVSWPVVYRLVRAAIVTAVAQTVAMSVNWSNPEQATRTVAVSLSVGFLLALGKGIRDTWGHEDDSKGAINRLLPI